jgi:hypothetical protein
MVPWSHGCSNHAQTCQVPLRLNRVSISAIHALNSAILLLPVFSLLASQVVRHGFPLEFFAKDLSCRLHFAAEFLTEALDLLVDMRQDAH